MKNVLLLATRYDAASYYTYQWAESLQEDLVKQGTTCILFDVTGVSSAGSELDRLINCVDYLVFYGHGEVDQWTALPASTSGKSVALIDTTSVNRLQRCKVYASCCSSVAQLGAAYAKLFTTGEYIGYNKPFGFELENRHYFQDIVNQSVISFIKGASASKVANDLANEWARLRDDFSTGKLSHRPNHVMASDTADRNRKSIQNVP